VKKLEAVKTWFRRMLTIALVAIGFGYCAAVQAASNIAGVLTEVEGYVDTGIAIGILVLLWVLGRRVARKTAG